MKIELTNQEVEMIVTGLQMRMAKIETGDVNLRAIDAENMNQHRDPKALNRMDRPVKINALTVSQMKFIVHSEDLIDRLRKR